MSITYVPTFFYLFGFFNDLFNDGDKNAKHVSIICFWISIAMMIIGLIISIIICCKTEKPKGPEILIIIS